MRIIRIVIENYKSISKIDIKTDNPVNVFIGENSVGKSNIFSAIEWILGPIYPSFNSFSKEDYYKGNMSLRVSVKLYFDDGNYLEMTNKWYDSYKNVKSGLNLNGNKYVSDDIRQKYVSAFIGVDRKINANPATNRWSLLGRLLRDINDRFMNEEVIDPNDERNYIKKSDLFKYKMSEIRDEILFSVNDNDGNNIMKQFTDILGKETAKQLNRTPEDFSIDLNMYDPWNYYRTLQIIVNEAETGMTFLASDLGMGVQASITIAILKAYSKLKLNNQTPILIDEPELFLHPQGRRNFYKIIRELADNGTQVFITTHSSEFIDLRHFNEIFVVRKTYDKGTYIRFADPNDFVADYMVRYPDRKTTKDEILELYNNAFENTGDSMKSSEAMFARKIILVEGESETIILPYFFDLIGFDHILNGITIVRCGGKNEIDRFYRLYSEFGIPCYVIFDGDYQNTGTKDEQSTIKKNKNILSLFNEEMDFPDNEVHDKYLGFTYRLEENLGIGSVGKNVKALNLYRKVKDNIFFDFDVPEWVYKVRDKIMEMDDESDSVLEIFWDF